jgi:hypothetical protein
MAANARKNDHRGHFRALDRNDHALIHPVSHPEFLPGVAYSRRMNMAEVNDTSDTGGKAHRSQQGQRNSVYNTAGEKLGSFNDVMIDKATGKSEYARSGRLGGSGKSLNAVGR